MRRIIVLNDADNVGTSLDALDAGATVDVRVDDASCAITVRDAIPFGHKLAIRDLAAGDAVVKYGSVIGRAARPIASGEWVHVHNVESVRGRGDIE